MLRIRPANYEDPESGQTARRGRVGRPDFEEGVTFL